MFRVYIMSIKIISGHAIFNENAVILSQKFNWKLESDFLPKEGDLYIVLGGHELAYQLLEIQYRMKSSFGYIVLNSEQITSQFFKNKYYIQLMKRNVVFDYNTITKDYLKQTHNIKVLSFFFFEFMKYKTETTERDVDITFIGSNNEYRNKMMIDLQEEFPEKKFYIDFAWKHSSSESITDIFQDSKIVLNMAYYQEHRPLETHRINKALACGCDVISTMSDDADANDFYKDYAYMTDDIKATLHQYFNKELEEKKGYEELIKQLCTKFHPHFYFMVDHIHKKLLSLYSIDESTDTNVSEPPSANTNLSGDSQATLEVRDKV